ncbi:MAG: hypothetical protein Q7K43_05620 [Candidatus Woesearchaeota archaeon]|nr:hypothetical protein [Candidatus Woesearchaeota archaeon]
MKTIVALARALTVRDSLGHALRLLGKEWLKENSHVCIVPHISASRDLLDEFVHGLKGKTASLVIGSRGIDQADILVALQPAHIPIPIAKKPDLILLDCTNSNNNLVSITTDCAAAEATRLGLLKLTTFSQENIWQDTVIKQAIKISKVKSIKDISLESYNVAEIASLLSVMQPTLPNFKKQSQKAVMVHTLAQRNPAEWKQDPKGYFLIKIEEGLIKAGFCTNDHIVREEVSGTEPQDIYYTILRRGLISSLQHAAYLGMELQKAQTALQLNIPYVQCSPLVLN